jgi:hypothetical protein
MSSTSINNTMAILLLASVVTLVGGLMVIPALEEAEAKECIGFKKNGKPCKPGKI